MLPGCLQFVKDYWTVPVCSRHLRMGVQHTNRRSVAGVFVKTWV